MATAAIDKELATFQQLLDVVMVRLEKNLLDVLGGATTATEVFDSTILLNSQPAMIESLREAGYFALADQHVATFQAIPPATIEAFKMRNLPLPKDVSGDPLPYFSTADKVDMQALAAMDLDQFNNIGVSAMNELRLLQVQNAVSGVSFSLQVEAIRAATVGVGKSGSPLANHAYTHANTSILNFQGETITKAAESIGVNGEDDLWEVSGVSDGRTRDVCLAALADPIRTRKEWDDAGYPVGGTPGGWNCRHQFFPFFGEVDGN